MSTKPETKDEETGKVESEAVADEEKDESEEDTEGHSLGLASAVAWELAKAKEREVSHNAARHTLIAQAKNRVRTKR